MSEFESLIKKASKDWKAPHMMEVAPKGKKLPFSSPLLNWATYGGIPRYKITELFGDYGSGKSTTSLDLCKNAIEVFQSEWEEELVGLRESGTKESKVRVAELEELGPRKVLYIDLEHSFDNSWAKTMGVDMDALQVMQPPDTPAEQILELLKNLVTTNETGLIILDSLPSLVTEAELGKKFGERTVASVAGLLTSFTRKIVPLLPRHGSTLVVINQIRENFDNPFDVKTPGGKSVPFYAALRLQCMMGNPIDMLGNDLPQRTEDPAGYLMKVRVRKQKSAPFDRKNASYYLLCDSGIKPSMDYGKLAIDSYGIIKKSGSWFTVCDPETGEIIEEDGSPERIQGQANVYDYIESHPEYYSKLKAFVDRDINGEDPDDEVSVDSGDVGETDGR